MKKIFTLLFCVAVATAFQLKGQEPWQVGKTIEEIDNAFDKKNTIGVDKVVYWLNEDKKEACAVTDISVDEWEDPYEVHVANIKPWVERGGGKV